MKTRLSVQAGAMTLTIAGAALAEGTKDAPRFSEEVLNQTLRRFFSARIMVHVSARTARWDRDVSSYRRQRPDQTLLYLYRHKYYTAFSAHITEQGSQTYVQSISSENNISH